MKIRFFAEGGKNIGFGHINRCLSLGQAFKTFGYHCQFNISGDESVKNLINDFDLRIGDWISNLNSLLYNTNKNDILVFDSYKASANQYDKIFNTHKHLVIFDDFDRIEYPAGIIINGSLNANAIYQKSNPDLHYLLGPNYQTVRKEFWDIEVCKKNNIIKNILITFGGDDSRNLTVPVLKFLNDKIPDIFKNVIVGKSFSNKEQINKFSNDKTKILNNQTAKQICDLMLESDIAICGAGQTLYELARTKTPSLFIGIAENQTNNIKSWSEYPFFEFLGWWNRSNIIGRLHKSFSKFDANFRQISEDIYSSDFIIDGNGSKNIVEKVLSYVRTH